MVTNLETIKGEYLKEFNRSIPRLKELAIALRAEDGQIPPEGDDFWELTDNPKINYELCQLAHDLEAMNEFWDEHPDNAQSCSLPFDVVRATLNYTQKFRELFPILKESGEKLSSLINQPGFLSDKQMGEVSDLMSETTGELATDCHQFFANLDTP